MEDPPCGSPVKDYLCAPFVGFSGRQLLLGAAKFYYVPYHTNKMSNHFFFKRPDGIYVTDAIYWMRHGSGPVNIAMDFFFF